MIISIINHSNGQVTDEQLQGAIRAINRQIAEDYEPYWSIGATLRLEGRSGQKPQKQNIADMRGDAVIYLWDKVDVEGALGYHDANNRGIPYGFVFKELSKKLVENWTVAISFGPYESLSVVAEIVKDSTSTSTSFLTSLY